MKSYSDELRAIKKQNRYRSREIVTSAQGVDISLSDSSYLSFCSNDYLGLANDERVKQAMIEGVHRYGVGSGAAHLISGHFESHHLLEKALAKFTGRSRALLFSTGYMANMGVVDALTLRNEVVLEDKLNHASLIDAGLYSKGTLQRYFHGDVVDLEKKLVNAGDNALVVTDGVFSMDGDIAPLEKILSLSQQYNAQLFVDDAHGIGVLGKHGGGVCDELSLDQDDLPIIMGTLGKAFGVCGAFVAGSHELIELLIQKARTYVYTTAMPPAMAHATLESLAIINSEPQRRIHLQHLITYFKEKISAIGLTLMPSQTPIQPLLVGDEEKALAWSHALRNEGLLVKAIRPPTVPKGTSRLRITFSSKHAVEDVDRLVAALAKLT